MANDTGRLESPSLEFRIAGKNRSERCQLLARNSGLMAAFGGTRRA